jgi:glucose/mannose-6-phosphate isomerase
LCGDPAEEIAECVGRLETLAAVYSAPGSPANGAAALASRIGDAVPVIYCANELDAVGLRWKNQFCENSKRLAFVSFFPEASHNEVMGWEASRVGIDAAVIVLRTSDEHPDVSRLLSLVGGVVEGKARFCGEFWGDGSSLLCRMFSLILLGDYASVYLAIAGGFDPTPIGTIDKLKKAIRGKQAGQ